MDGQFSSPHALRSPFAPFSRPTSLFIRFYFNISHTTAMPSASQYKPFLDLINAIHLQAETARYLAISGIALLLYDWLTTLDEEVKYIWGRKWTLARMVYHLNRVLPLLLIGFDTQCKKIILSYSYGVIALLVLICTTSIIRCWALYGQKWILWLLIPGLIVTVGHATLEATINIDKTTALVNPVPELLQGCLVSIPNDIWLAYFSGVLYEVVVFCLIVWRIWYLGDGLGLTPLMRQLLNNGAWYFAVNLALMLFSCVGSAYPSTIIMANGSGLLTALSSIMCSRIFFSMHEFASQDRVHLSLGPPLGSSVRGSGIITGEFAIPMETFSDGSRSPSGLQVTFDTPPQSLGRSTSSKGKSAARSSDKLSV
ncbi:unnamed protein product [Rhizoctonia solani]|uniref:DUF6533 domain-containing protein n=1 Tax=Rhizoctonia solani TaxID=456999 RepID=A0A8H3A9P5_9AGAM|nr:unnamed protein product [Rhizoctonia solani]